MEAANRGASEANGINVGLTISLPFEASENEWISDDLNLKFHYFFMRKFWFLYLAKGLIVWPGGFGTLDEFFEAITLIQTEKIGRFPIVLVGRSFWKGLIDWIEEVVLGREKNINTQDMQLINIVDTAEEAVDTIDEFYSYYLLSPNF